MNSNINDFKYFLILVILLLTMPSCSNDDISDEISYPRNIEPIIMSYGFFVNTNSDSNAHYIEINNSDQLNSFVTEYNNYGPIYQFQGNEYNGFYDDGFTAFSELDYNTKTFLFCIDNERPHSGYELIHNAIIEHQSFIEVIGQSNELSSGFGTFIQPFYMVVIPKTTKPIEFEIIE